MTTENVKGRTRQSASGGPLKVTSYAAVAAELGVARSTIARAKLRFVDAPRRDTESLHDIADWRAFFARHPEIRPRSAKARAEIVMAGGQLSKSEADEAWANERARKLKLANDEKEKILLRRETVDRAIVAALSGARSLLCQKMLNEWPFQMEGLSAPVIAERMKIEEQQIHDEMRKMLKAVPEMAKAS